MSEGKKCPNCGACKECGARPQPVVVYPWVYPWTQPYPWGRYPYTSSPYATGRGINISSGAGTAQTTFTSWHSTAGGNYA